MTAGRRQLMFGQQLTHADKGQAAVFQPDKLHPAEFHTGVPGGIVGQHNLIGRQGHLQPMREEHKRTGRPVANNRQRRRPVLLQQ